MNGLFTDELFTDKPIRTQPTPINNTGSGKKPVPQKAKKPPVPAEGEGSTVQQTVISKPQPKPAQAEKREDVLLQRVESACGGNRYLEGMILGEILNTPKWRR